MASLTEQLERRQFDRVPAIGDVRLHWRGDVIDAELADVGEGGIRCVVPATGAPTEGDVLQAHIQLGDGPLTVDAQVMRAVGDGATVQLGLQFHTLSADAHRRLVQYVQSLTPKVTTAATG